MRSLRKYKTDLTQREDKLAHRLLHPVLRPVTAPSMRDDYVTNLANVASNVGISEGSYFCDRNVPVFDEVMALRSNAELADFAAAKSLTQPLSTSACGATPAREAGTTHPTRRRKS